MRLYVETYNFVSQFCQFAVAYFAQRAKIYSMIILYIYALTQFYDNNNGLLDYLH